eukprot:TRINITY_DN4486_c0_g1_i2.p1 TRINITY_DN4486_c0_g1~~TRINITY_DN4486_c0_g1_i2.p1  ORF type:complete len:143 (-),score=8.71 TRINITY_DN4486_c0_g1_i2:157-585(-)
MASVWTRIGQEEHLMGRAGIVGDEIGSTIIANRLVRDIMKLCFMMEKKYIPYAKWFGTAFGQLLCAKSVIQDILRRTQLAVQWSEREKYLNLAYEFLAKKHNDLKITCSLPDTVSNFFNRPFKTLHRILRLFGVENLRMLYV